MKNLRQNYKRIVIKIGSSILTSERSGGIDSALLERIASQIAGLVRDKKEVVIVSSGAIACGLTSLNANTSQKVSRQSNLSYLQAAAAVGQNALMNVYRIAFAKKRLSCGQVLLTWDDFDCRRRYLNAKNTILTLLKFKFIPIINENDTVSTEEIRFGDNDKLSGLVANLIQADLLLILSDVDGLLTEDRKDVVRLVDEITPAIKRLASGSDKKTCVGGMITKIEAAKMVMDSGIPCAVVNGRKDAIVLSALEDISSCGTLFLPKGRGLEARKRWIAFGAKIKGKVIIDDGAKEALVKRMKSLLSPGIVNVEGDFDAGSIVSILDKQKTIVGRGICAVSSEELKKIKGKRYHKEVIHRNNLVIV